MPDFKKMTLERLRELARKTLGPGSSRLTKAELVRALEQAKTGGRKAAEEAGTRARKAGTRAAEATGKAVRAVKEAGAEGARAVARGGKAAAEAAVEGARAGKKVAKRRKAGTVGTAAAAAVGAVAGLAAAAKKPRRAPPEGLPDPEGYFVARVRGEEAVREAPHAMAEGGADRPYPTWAEGVGDAPVFDERLGELPWSYGDDAFVALPRDPKTLFLYWDHARATLDRAFAGLEQPRVQLWVFVRADAGWDRLRTLDFALESRGFYVHDLEPGRTYRAEIRAVDGQGNERLVGRGSNEVVLPRVGPSPILDDRFIRIPWDMPLGRLLGPGHPGAPFSEDARRLLERLSDWSRFAGSTWGSAGGMGGRPSSPTSPPSSPVRGPGGER